MNAILKPEPVQSEVNLAIDSLRSNSKRLEDVLNSLGSRLTTVLRPATACDTVKCEPVYSTALAQQINNEAQDIGKLANAVGDVLSRLEL